MQDINEPDFFPSLTKSLRLVTAECSNAVYSAALPAFLNMGLYQSEIESDTGQLGLNHK